MERLLVLGASGLVGGDLVRRARSHRQGTREVFERVVGAARTLQGEATETLDLAHRESIARLAEELRPTAVAVCSAWPHVDGCESDPERSHRENVETVTNLIEVLDSSKLTRGARIVFFSTDHVFDGEKVGPYVESDPTHPLSVYARHKLEVENLLGARGNALVVRTAWVFGVEIRKKNFVYRVLQSARRGEALQVPVGQAGSPTFSGWLSDSVLTLLVDQRLDGIVHLTGPATLTKAEWGRLIARELGLGPLDVHEVDWKEAGQIAPRPVRVELGSVRHNLVQPDLGSILHAIRAALV